MSSVTPFFSIRVSSSAASSSNVKPYWKPEQPPPVTNTRSLSSGLPSSSISDFTFVAAASVKTSGGGISVIAFIANSSVTAHNLPDGRWRGQRRVRSLAGGALELDDRRGLLLGVHQ